MRTTHRWKCFIPLGLAMSLALFGAAQAGAIIIDIGFLSQLHEAQAEHVDQQELYDLVVAGNNDEAREDAFEDGDELFETVFNAIDGVGANVGDGQRFTRVPRADLTGANEWANHFPPRATGPNGQSCNECHSVPGDDGAGKAFANVHRDPLHSADIGQFINRNTPHLFAAGPIQRLAEEMTVDLFRDRDVAIGRACVFGVGINDLDSKGVRFGFIKAIRTHILPCRVTLDTSKVEGVDADLVVKPFQWKGNFTTIRSFNRDASHNEIGMQAVEIVGFDVDGDFDNVVNEMTIGDQTALAVYIASQPRPVSTLELDALGILELTQGEKDAIARGSQRFNDVGCNSCHRPKLLLDVPIFSEPSQLAAFRDDPFPAGIDPVEVLVDPNFAITVDLTQDQPDNIIEFNGQEVHLGSLETDGNGRGIVRLYSDLKRHDMGPGLAENIDEAGTGPSTWLTQELWGIGTTAPYMHDGRSTTLTEAILEHGGEGDASRQAFEGLSVDDQSDLIAFLNSLVLFKADEG